MKGLWPALIATANFGMAVLFATVYDEVVAATLWAISALIWCAVVYMRRT